MKGVHSTTFLTHIMSKGKHENSRKIVSILENQIRNHHVYSFEAIQIYRYFLNTNDSKGFRKFDHLLLNSVKKS